MAEHIEALQRLAEQFARLPGIGRKSAMRLAFSILELSDEQAENFANTILEAKQKVHLCPVCQSLTDKEICSVCNDLSRDKSTIMVLEDTKAVLSMEKVREYRGLYHVLHGVISPMNGVTPDKLKIKELLDAEILTGEDLIEALRHDKKISGSEITLICVEKIGEFVMKKMPFSDFAEKVKEDF